MNLVDGEVFGPYIADGYQKISRLVSRKPNAAVKASHILISYAGTQIPTATRTKEEAQALANNLLAQVKANPASFGTLAAQNSDDPGSKDKGGEYDDIQKDQMVKPFNDFIFNNSVGTVGVVETDFGFHVIKVLDKYSSVLLGTVAKKIEPSNETINKIFEKASKLEEDVASGKSLADVAKVNALTVVPVKSVRPSEEYIQGFGANREVVRWMFSDDSKVNDVKRFDVPQGYLIAKLTNKNDTGLLDIETAKSTVGVQLMNEKKAAIIKKKMVGTSLEALAKSTGGSVLFSGPVAIGNSNIPNIGAEPKVVGAALKLGKDKISDTIDGNTGVFVVKTSNIIEAPVVSSYASFIDQEKAQQKGAAQERAYQALKVKADVKDSRGRF
jgi:peptidyl-prolyl cis-trans isomerase D